MKRTWPERQQEHASHWWHFLFSQQKNKEQIKVSGQQQNTNSYVLIKNDHFCQKESDGFKSPCWKRLSDGKWSGWNVRHGAFFFCCSSAEWNTVQPLHLQASTNALTARASGSDRPPAVPPYISSLGKTAALEHTTTRAGNCLEDRTLWHRKQQ